MTPPAPPTLTHDEQERMALVDRHAAAGAIAELVPMLTDPSWTVRRAVVASLAAAGDVAVGPLVTTLRTQRDSETRIAAAVDALVASNGFADEAAAQLAGDANAAVAADAAQILGRRRAQMALPTLIRLLAHADDNVAVAAVEALGRIGGRAAVESLIDLVRSRNFFRTFPAIDVLGRSGDPRAVAPLAALLDQPHYALEAARALGRTGERAAVAPLTALLATSSQTKVRIAAVALHELYMRHRERFGLTTPLDDALRRAVDTPAVTRRLVGSLGGADPGEQAAIAHLMGILRDDGAVPTLMTLLEEPPLVATAAAEALERLGGAEDEELVRELAAADSARRVLLLPLARRVSTAAAVSACLHDPDAAVRAAACEALARIGNPTVVPALFEQLADQNPRVSQAAVGAIQSLGSIDTERLALAAARSDDATERRAALRILSYFGYASALPIFAAAIAGDDARARDIAVHGLPFVDDPRAMEQLLETTRASSERLRGAAMRALGQSRGGDPRVTSALLRGIADDDAWVRYYAIQSLGRLGAEAAASAVAARVADPAGQVRVAAIEALSHLRGEIAFAALRQAAGSADADLRRAALVGLGLSRRAEAEPILLAAAGDLDPATRLVAVSAVADFEGPEALAVLERGARDPDESVRTAAIGFLAPRPTREATEALIRLLALPTERERVLRALAIFTPEHMSGIVAALKTADDELASNLVSALVRMRRPEASAALIDAFTLPNTRARKAIASGLAAISSTEAALTLQRAAKGDSDPEVRRIATLLLAQ